MTAAIGIPHPLGDGSVLTKLAEGVWQLDHPVTGRCVITDVDRLAAPEPADVAGDLLRTGGGV